jgi:hypothetical protein
LKTFKNIKKTKKTKKGGAPMAERFIQNDTIFYNEPIRINLNEAIEEAEEQITNEIKIKVKKLKHYENMYDVEYGPYSIRTNNPYAAKLAIYALLMCEKRLLSDGYVEMIVDWDEKDWTRWDPYRVFDYERFKIFRKGNFKMDIGDCLIDLEVRRILALFEKKFRVYIKGFVIDHPVLE